MDEFQVESTNMCMSKYKWDEIAFSKRSLPLRTTWNYRFLELKGLAIISS
jgi:hypothetical protein